MDGLDEQIRHELGKRIFSLGGPAGAGKDVNKQILKSIHDNVSIFPRTTTRPPRDSEIDGVDYFFVDRETFLTQLKEGSIIAIDLYAKYYYGIDINQLVNTLVKSKDRKIITVGGICGIHLKPHFPTMTNIYLVASLEELHSRVRQRGGDPKAISESMKEAERRLEEEPPLFDYVVKNHDSKLDQTVARISEIMGLPMPTAIKEVIANVKSKNRD